tara:strand:+ start:49 stop:342 length:294 start_codon:yes stop_codon:yes gene_type:complete
MAEKVIDTKNEERTPSFEISTQQFIDLVCGMLESDTYVYESASRGSYFYEVMEEYVDHDTTRPQPFELTEKEEKALEQACSMIRECIEDFSYRHYGW